MNNLPAFNGLVPKDILSQEIFTNIYRKVQQYQKVCSTVSNFFAILGKEVEINYASMLKQILPTEEFLEADPINENTYLLEFYTILKSISNGYNKFILTYSTSLKEYIEEIENEFNDLINTHLSKSKNNFENYKNLQQNLYEIYKKYVKYSKNLNISIINYENSIAAAKFVYNKNQKIKRYSTCKKLYDEFLEVEIELNNLVEDANLNKNELILNFNVLVDNYKKFVKFISEKILFQVKKIMVRLNNLYKQLINDMSVKRKTLQNINIKSYFCDLEVFINVNDYINNHQIKSFKFIPVFITNHKDIKPAYLVDYERWIKEYFLNIKQKYEVNKKTLRLISSFVIDHIKNMQKHKDYLIRELSNAIQKFKKSICDDFGITIYSYLKGIQMILENTPKISEKVMKIMNTKLASILYFVNQDQKIGDVFFKELYKRITQHTNVKKALRLTQKSQYEQSYTLNKQQIRQLKKSIHQTSESIETLIMVSNEKVEKNLKLIKLEIDSVFSYIYYSFHQIFKDISEYHSNFFGNQFQVSLSKTSSEINEILEKDKLILDMISQNTVIELEESQKFNHDQFKKIKQPIDLTSSEYQQNDSIKIKEQEIQKLEQQNKHKYTGRIQKKYYQFLKERITFEEGEIYLNSFDCAFNDKIVLQGRMYITNMRICFHSYFNIKNIFFGETFLEIPKKDLIKVQKRYTILIFDNSLAITTVNGCMIFTSFSKRDSAYDLIMKTFNINNSQIQLSNIQILNQNQNQQKIVQQKSKKRKVSSMHHQFNSIQEMRENQISRVVEPDSLTKQQQRQRKKKFEYLYKKPFKQFFNFKIFNTNCLQLLRNYFTENTVTIQGRKYRSFIYYFKEVHVGQKQIKYERWNPEVSQYLNQYNIKSNTPLQFKKNLEQKHPMKNPIPFMPDFCTSNQYQTLLIISSSHFIIENIIVNKGAPLADNFKAHLRHEFINNQDNVQFLGHYYIEMVKPTIMKSIIDSESSKEMKISAQLLCRIINERIKSDTVKVNKLQLAGSQISIEESNNNKGSMIGQQQKINNKLIRGKRQKQEKVGRKKHEDTQAKQQLQITKQKYDKQKQKNSLFKIILAVSIFINLLAIIFYR